MPKTKKVEDVDSPEWTAEMAEKSVRMKDLPANLQRTLAARQRGQRGPQKAPTKEAISIRLSQDVVSALRAKGPGWQTMADEALRKAFVS